MGKRQEGMRLNYLNIPFCINNGEDTEQSCNGARLAVHSPLAPLHFGFGGCEQCANDWVVVMVMAFESNKKKLLNEFVVIAELLKFLAREDQIPLHCENLRIALIATLWCLCAVRMPKSQHFRTGEMNNTENTLLTKPLLMKAV